MRVSTARVKSKVVGNIFEQLFYRSVQRQGMACLRIPDSCKTIGPKKIIRIKSPFDYVVMSKGRCLFIDTKTQGTGSTFPRANINHNQVFAISYMVQNGAQGGFICWFRGIDKVVFFECEKLRLAEAGLHWEEGLYLGTIEDINIERIYESI